MLISALPSPAVNPVNSGSCTPPTAHTHHTGDGAPDAFAKLLEQASRPDTADAKSGPRAGADAGTGPGTADAPADSTPRGGGGNSVDNDASTVDSRTAPWHPDPAPAPGPAQHLPTTGVPVRKGGHLPAAQAQGDPLPGPARAAMRKAVAEATEATEAADATESGDGTSATRLSAVDGSLTDPAAAGLLAANTPAAAPAASNAPLALAASAASAATAAAAGDTARTRATVDPAQGSAAAYALATNANTATVGGAGWAAGRDVDTTTARNQQPIVGPVRTEAADRTPPERAAAAATASAQALATLSVANGNGSTPGAGQAAGVPSSALPTAGDAAGIASATTVQPQRDAAEAQATTLAADGSSPSASRSGTDTMTTATAAARTASQADHRRDGRTDDRTDAPTELRGGPHRQSGGVLTAERADPQAGAAAAAVPLPGALAWINAAPAGINAQAAAAPTDGRIAASPGSHEFAPQLAAHITTFVRDGLQNVRLELNPGEMGPLTVQIQLDGNAARVHLAAEHAGTRAALEQAMPQLAGSLRESGLTLSGGGVFEQPRQPQQQPQASHNGSGGNNGTADDSARDGRNSGNARGASSNGLNGLNGTPATLGRRRTGVVDLIA